ncbi:nuclear transport factor 2 family protein [Saccharopolyspora sp. K220]|uniref:nuclear transport factor 2 family protein n=1 Tax=Saccharopolyspora soli TaxID=2926618 RepID=UPI001F56D577|nr:nuclear transport factor 2 family protein [Saccharopolyspora soli]MCI2422969.1 nuclear transport factor 2 family protein [Saccharopolyspora soli]
MSDKEEAAMGNVEVLMAVEEIRRLEARYARYADEKRWTELAGLFTVDGTFTSLDVDGKPVADMSGRQEIAASLTAVNAGNVTPIHMLLTSEVDVISPTRAHGVWAMADLIFRDDDPPAHSAATGNVPPFRQMRGWGHYHVDYVKIDGSWYVSKRVQTRTRLEFRS